MYYYIVEPLTTQAEKKKLDDIKAMLAQLGITGEFAIASPARTAEEHLELAIRKNFTTIVGIGSDALANTIASGILDHGHDQIAMGVIPLDANQTLWQLTGNRSLKEASQALRQRLLSPITAIELNPTQVAITDVVITQPQPVKFQIAYNTIELSGQLTDLTINRQGLVQFWDQSLRPTAASPSWLQRIFSSAPIDQSISQFTALHWQLATETPVSVMAGGQIIAATPLTVTIRQKVLKLITNRAKMAPDNKQ